jgi:hypothetical protein
VIGLDLLEQYAHDVIERIPMDLPSTVLTVANAKKAIIAEWCTWAKKHGVYGITDMQIFYVTWLKRNTPELLSFKFDGDQWQVVRAWLQHDERLQSKLRKFQG